MRVTSILHLSVYSTRRAHEKIFAIRQFFKDLGQTIVKAEGPKPGRVLVTSHGGYIKELNMVLVKELGCSMPCQQGEYGRISPNTGVTRVSLTLEPELGAVTAARCSLLYYKDHLDGLEYHEPLHYGV